MRISATTLLAAENSATWFIMFAAETLLASYCAKRGSTSTPFALGVLSHYASDIVGHPALNQPVAIQYPKLRAKLGKSVRYAQDKTAHKNKGWLRHGAGREESLCVSAVPRLHQSIEILVEGAFPIVYLVELKDVLTHGDLAVGSYVSRSAD